ncbi:MAG TPA: MFS transporter [Bryobacteraceae bacterium]|nr:MFS transporter [Bryobacteraceae bacterium]
MHPQIQREPDAQTDVWSLYRKALTLLAAIAVIFDGFDIQILGFAIPSIMKEWHVTRAALAPVAALGLTGMAVGSPFAGWCGDRFGRRCTLIGCIAIFALATLATAFCGNLIELAILRALAGLGAGGALPNAGALVAEFAPLRRRAMAVSLTIVCVPLGGMFAGVIAGRVLPSFGWHVLYIVGGAAPLIFALVLMAVLPESPHYVARAGHGGSVRDLFAPALRRDTLGLWLAFFSCLGGIYLVFSWLPAMLSARGLDVAAASAGLASYNFGGVLGVLIIVAAVTAIGSRGPLLTAALAGSASALVLLWTPGSFLIAGLGVHGFFVNAAQTTMYALASHVYPARVRATGIACSAAVGRCGGILSSLGGAAIIQRGSSAYPGALGFAFALTFAGLVIVRNHCPGRKLSTES